MKTFLITLALLLATTSPGNSHAMDIDTYKKYKSIDLSIIKVYVAGLGEGYSWANTLNKSSLNRSLMFCPGTDKLNVDDYMKIIDQQVELLEKKSPASYNQFPIDLLLGHALIKKYPCDNPQGIQ